MPSARIPNQTRKEFDSALEALNRLLRESLWRAKAYTASAAWSAIEHSGTDDKKIKIIERQLRTWKVRSAAAIREWLPKYMALVLAHPDLIGSNAKQWTYDRVMERLTENFGTEMTSVFWWLSFAVNGTVDPMDVARWEPPSWLIPSGITRQTIRGKIGMPFVILIGKVVDEELDKARVQNAIIDKHKRALTAKKDADHGWQSKAASGDLSAAGAPRQINKGRDSFPFSEDYRGVLFRKRWYPLTRNQSLMVRVMYQAFLDGFPDVHKDKLLTAIESETSSVRDSWRASPLWNTLVVSRKKGTYRLNLSL